MLPYHRYALPDREEPGFRKAQKEILSILGKECSRSRIIEILYKELEENEDDATKEFLAFVSKECNPQRKVHFAEVSYIHKLHSAERIPFNTFSRRLITKDESIIDNPIETAEDGNSDSREL